MTSIREVAKKAGVSPATVSRTFSAPDLLKTQTQQRVLEAARLLDYHPPHLRSLKPRRAMAAPGGALGFQFLAGFPDDSLVSNMFYAPILSGALAEADSEGMHLVVHTTDRHRIGQAMPRMVREKVISGLLLVGAADSLTLKRFSEQSFPVILVDNLDPDGRTESVVSDGFGGIFTATTYLQSLGHRRIAFFHPEENIYTFTDRLRGYLAAHQEAGLVPDPRWIVRGFTENPDREASRIAALTALLRQSERPTALICANDTNAILALRLCRELGVRIPEDLSLIGFDNIPFSGSTEPALTTVHVDTERIGRLAVQRLLSLLARKEKASSYGVQNRLPVSLVVRGSCRAISA